MSGRVDAREGLRLGASLPACVRRTASLGNDPVSPAAAAAAEDYDGWARDGTADGRHALAGKWPRRLTGAFLALAPNPIDTRALATRALATAPESAGIGDMQGKATPGLGTLGGGIAGTIGGLLGALGEAAVEEGTEHAGEAVEGAGEAEQKAAGEAQEQAAREFIERFNASGEKALDRLHGARADHILHSNLHPEEHDWKQPFDGQEPTWEQVKSLLKKAIREGQESAHEDRLSQFERSIEYNGRRVFVRFVKGADGLVEHISTGYFKGE